MIKKIYKSGDQHANEEYFHYRRFAKVVFHNDVISVISGLSELPQIRVLQLSESFEFPRPCSRDQVRF
jgi:hypothetical protein